MEHAIKYRLTGVFFFALLPFAVFGGMISYSNLPDSSRLQIRLKSFLLISPEIELPDFLFSSGLNAPVAFVFDGSHQPELIEKIRICSVYQPQTLIISKNNLPVPDTFDSGVIVCNPDDLDSLFFLCDTTSQRVYDSCLSKNELLKVTISDTTNSQEACFNLWKKTGKLPNFISVEPSVMNKAANIASRLNSTAKIYGVTLESGRPLTEVFWENNPGVKTYGYFSFPLEESAYHLIPYKAGYRFSPGIILQSTSNRKSMKIFHGIKHEPDFGLENHFTFHEKVRNEKWKNDQGILTNGVKFRKDKKIGWVACFENRAYVDAGPQSTKILSSGFSIIAWIKVNNSTQKNSILGKGRNFNLEIYEGKLTFSMADVKDYISEKSLVPVGLWTQVAMVYSKFNNQIYFYLNGKQTDQIDLIHSYEGSEYTLLIGNNLWEEFFHGEIGEIKIWDRELDKDEIYYQYLHPVHKRNSILFVVILLIVVVTGAGAFLVFRSRERHKKRHDPGKTSRVSVVNSGTTKGMERIICFGGLKMFDSADKDIILKFSPKLKQIFTLILLYSHGDNKGITSKQMAEILWPGTSVANTKNIRSTYVQNLRSALSSCKNIRLVFSNKKWFFEFAEDFYNEYAEIENILPQLSKEEDLKVLEKQLPSAITILKKGRFLYGMEESWLDPFVEKMNNRIIEFCITMFSVLDDHIHSVLILDLAEIVSLADPLNEPALQKKVNLLIKQGKLSLAKNIYDNFVKLYKELYKEDYANDFKDIVAENS